MACRKLTYYENCNSLKVAYSKALEDKKNVQEFISPDPLTKLFAYSSPYVAMGDNPVAYIDKNGNFRMTPQQQHDYPQLTNILKNLPQLATSNPEVWAAFKKNLGLTEEQALSIVAWNSGPDVLIENLTNKNGKVEFGETDETSTTFNKEMVSVLEGTKQSKSASQADAAVLTFITALHEGSHYAEFNFKIPFFKSFGEVGFKFEDKAFNKRYSTADAKQFQTDQPKIFEAIGKEITPPSQDGGSDPGPKYPGSGGGETSPEGGNGCGTRNPGE